VLFVSERNQYAVSKLKHVVVLGVLSLTLSVCNSDSGNLFGHSAPVPGSIGSAQASMSVDSGVGEISLVSLAFPYTEEIGNLSSVVDRISGKPIPYHSVVWNRKVVVTLELTKNVTANPNLVFDGDASFTAFLTPEHSLSTFDELTFGGNTIFLRDHGVELKLQEGIQTMIAQSDLTSLWNGERMVMGTRANFSPEKTGNYGPILEPETGTVTVKMNTTLLTWKNALNLGGNESASLVVAPPTDTETISFSVVER